MSTLMNNENLDQIERIQKYALNADDKSQYVRIRAIIDAEKVKMSIIRAQIRIDRQLFQLDERLQSHQ